MGGDNRPMSGEVRRAPDVSEATLRMRGCILVLDAQDLRVRMASAAAPALLGYRQAELASLTLHDLVPALSAPAWQRRARRMAARAAVATGFRRRVRRRNGSEFPAEIRLQLAGADGTLFASIDPPFGNRDARPYEAALLRSVINTAPDAILTIDVKGRVGTFSPAAERMFGYAASEVTGRNVNMLMPEPYRSQHDGYLARYLTTGEKRIIGIGRTVTARHKDGHTFPIELAVGEVRVADSHMFTGFIRDISERVAAHERGVKLQQELSHVGRLSAMGEVASMIVHELNQPLTAIANFGEAARRLIESGGDPARAASFMEKAVAQAHRASEMIRRLRSFVSRGPTEREPIAVNEVVRDAARLALIGAADQQIHTRFELAEGLPEVTADRIQVQQVVVNLIRNGIDAMIEAGAGAGTGGEEPPLVVATGRAPDGAILVSVTDSGPGIAPEIAGGLFTPFVTTKPTGMGIGLSISRSIIEAHGGRIWCEPRPEGGTRFTFTLPLAAYGAGP